MVKRSTDARELRWADMLRTLSLFGVIPAEYWKKSTSLSVAMQLKRLVADGKVIRVKRGLYRVPV